LSGGADRSCARSSAEDHSGEATVTITARAFEFQPDCLVASRSTSLILVNEDAAYHTFTVTRAGVDVPLPVGETSTVEPTELQPGTYDFLCSVHPSMRGTLILE
jgi:plastocyanin